jgi:hypothetical protein
MAASARISCPLASSYLAVSVQDLMAADNRRTPAAVIAAGGQDERVLLAAARAARGGGLSPTPSADALTRENSVLIPRFL